MTTLHDAKLCPDCGKLPQMESDTPEGRLKPVWRVVCACGQGPRQWSVTPEAAVRLWNRMIGEQSGAAS